jgi:hypothetical protein
MSSQRPDYNELHAAMTNYPKKAQIGPTLTKCTTSIRNVHWVRPTANEITSNDTIGTTCPETIRILKMGRHYERRQQYLRQVDQSKDLE